MTHRRLPKRSLTRRRHATIGAAGATRGPCSRELRRLARRRAERGIILVFVVVLLSLLAIMGTAYLAVARQDRQALTGTGTIPGYAQPRLKNRDPLDRIYTGAVARTKLQLIGGLFNLQPGQIQLYQGDAALADPLKRLVESSFRQQALGVTSAWYAGSAPTQMYHNYDAAGPTDPFLASLLAVQKTPIAGNDAGGTPLDTNAAFQPVTNNSRIRWQWISAPLNGEPRTAGPAGTGNTTDNGDVNFGADIARQLLPGIDAEPFFADPRFLTTANGYGLAIWAAGNTRDSHRNEVAITSVEMPRSNANTEPGKIARVYPGLLPLHRGPVATFIAGDADGDGIADCGLMPVVLNPKASFSADRYVDHENNVVYFVGYRIVDNSAKVNMGTALAVQGDFAGDASFAIRTSNNPGSYQANPVNNNTDGELRNALALEVTNAPGVGFASMPNRGFFASNVGLIEMLREQMRPFANTNTTYSANNPPSIRGIFDFIDGRFPLAAKAPANDALGLRLKELATDVDPNTNVAGIVQPSLLIGDRNTSTGVPNTKFVYNDLGELLQESIVRNPNAPHGVLWYDTLTDPTSLNTTGFKWLPTGDAISLASRDGALLNDLISPSLGENSLLLALQIAAPNYNAGGQTQKWKYFPPTNDTTSTSPQGVPLWFGWTQDFEALGQNLIVNGTPADPNAIGMLDGFNPSLGTPPNADPFRVFNFATGDTGYTSSVLPKSVRTLLTTYNGVTANTPRRNDLTNPIVPGTLIGLPAGMPVYDLNAQGFEVFPATKVSAATGTKEQLWRAYWSAMTHSVLNGFNQWTWEADTYGPAGVGGVPATYDAFQPTDRHPSMIDPPTMAVGAPHARLTPEQMTLIRSAVAACNTVDLRDSDDDVTAMTINIGTNAQPDPNGGAPAGSALPLFVRVFGTERQAVITSVVIDEPPTTAAGAPGPGTTPEMYVEIFNPSDQPLDLAGYRLGVVERDNPSGTIADGKVVVAPGLTDMIALCAANAPADRRYLQPGGFVIVYTGTATPDGSTNVVVPNENPDPTAAQPTQVLVRFDNDTNANLPTAPLIAAVDQATASKRELVLVRTRRADGVPTTEDPASLAASRAPRPAFSEGALTDVASLTSLVPMDAVDLRSLSFPRLTDPNAAQNKSGQRYVYQRTLPSNFDYREKIRDPEAWKVFYSGNGYDFRPSAAGVYTQPDPTTPPQVAGKPTNWAWREYPGLTSPASGAANDKPTNRMGYVSLGSLTEPLRHVPNGDEPTWVDPGAPPALPAAADAGHPFLAPTIPIQNFDPVTDFWTGTADPTHTIALDYAPNRFPYASPFARDGDVLAVPFVGTYQIWKYPASPWTQAQVGELYDYVPVTMDAWAVAPGDPANGPDTENPSVGRFDARTVLSVATPSNTAPTSFATRPAGTNGWADDLFDYVTARNSVASHSFPDVPFVGLQNVNPHNDPTAPISDQDGPVLGFDQTARAGGYAASNSTDATHVFHYAQDPATRVPWVRWGTLGGGQTSVQRNGSPDFSPLNAFTQAQVDAITGERALQQGILNVNTAPAINQRMLPFAVDITNGDANEGQVLTPVNSTVASNAEQRARAVAMETFNRAQQLANAPLGISSLLKLDDLPGFVTAGGGVSHDEIQAMCAGDLQPFYRPDAQLDFQTFSRDMTRISNLASTRSDVYTVYVTVQAWTWNGDANQGGDTRLVGERRGTFIIDRSRIQVKEDLTTGVLSGFKPSDLVTIPVDQD